jgi:hypothetical protein
MRDAELEIDECITFCDRHGEAGCSLPVSANLTFNMCGGCVDEACTGDWPAGEMLAFTMDSFVSVLGSLGCDCWLALVCDKDCALVECHKLWRLFLA